MIVAVVGQLVVGDIMGYCCSWVNVSFCIFLKYKDRNNKYKTSVNAEVQNNKS